MRRRLRGRCCGVAGLLRVRVGEDTEGDGGGESQSYESLHDEILLTVQYFARGKTSRDKHLAERLDAILCRGAFQM